MFNVEQDRELIKFFKCPVAGHSPTPESIAADFLDDYAASSYMASLSKSKVETKLGTLRDDNKPHASKESAVPSKEAAVLLFSKGDVGEQPDTNPKRQYGITSIPLNLWSPLASAYGALGLYNGAGKYGQGNFKATKVEASIYIAAAMRHLSAWAEGEEFDPKDGVPNLGGVLANIAILLEARSVGTLIDDRQISGGYLKERDGLEKIVKSLTKLHEGKSPKHYYITET